MTSVRRNIFATIVGALALQQVCFNDVQAQTAQAAVTNAGPSADQVFHDALTRAEEFDSAGWPPRGRFTVSPRATKALVDFNRRLWTDYSMFYLFSPTVMMQVGTQGGSQNFTASEQYQAAFGWRVFNKTPIGTGYFFFNNLHVSQLTRTSGVDFSQSLGINYFTSDSVGNTNVIKSLLWRHEFPRDVLTLFLGHGEIGSLDGGCRYACDDTQSFISSILSNNPTRTLPGQGTDLGADIKVTDGVHAELSMADARGNGKINIGRPFETGEWAYAGALKFENSLKQYGDGVYKFTYYSVEETRPGTSAAQAASQGVSVQLDQDFGDIGVFLKYHQAFKRKSLADKSAAAGVVWKAPFGNNEDRLGLGLGWIDPTAPDSNNEYVAETYYRIQLTPFVQVTADAMLTINPSRPGSSNEGVFSLRARGHF